MRWYKASTSRFFDVFKNVVVRTRRNHDSLSNTRALAFVMLPLKSQFVVRSASFLPVRQLLVRAVNFTRTQIRAESWAHQDNFDLSKSG
jgi:hypothetical protein